MNVDEEISLEWARIPHFYYELTTCYQYATGYAAAIALSQPHSEREGEPAVKDYLGFLSGGCSADADHAAARRRRGYGKPEADRGRNKAV